MAHEELEQGELAGRQHHRLPVPGHGVGGRVQPQATDGQHGRPLARAAARQRPQPRQQLPQRERLDQVVVGADATRMR